MTVADLPPAERPTIHFVGVTTGRSSIMRVFPRWAELLGLGDCRISGIDLAPHADPEAYRAVVRFIKQDPLSLGALVTTHKIDLYAAARDLFDEIDPHSRLMGETSCLSKRDGRLVSSAKDPITSALAMRDFLPEGYWRRTGAELLVLGAGGSAIAITAARMDPRHGQDRPARVIVTNRSLPRLDAIRRVHEELATGIPTDYLLAAEPAVNDAAVSRLPPGSVVVNATGLGKDAPGSPLTDAARFPENGIAWDLNYRGDLVFLDQARAQAAARRLRVEDGWSYFIHGWTQVIAEVFHITLPEDPAAFAALEEAAAAARG